MSITPEEMRRRQGEGTAVEPADQDELVTVAAGGATGDIPNNYGLPASARPVNAVIASAARINLNDKRSIASAKRRRQQWQTEAWDYYDEVGELGYTVSYMANLCSKLRLFPATRPDSTRPPIPVGEEGSGISPAIALLAVATLDRLRSAQGGQSAIIRDLSLNLDVSGECYLHGHDITPGDTTGPTNNENQTNIDDGDLGQEDWQIRSVDELVVHRETFALRLSPGAKDVTEIPVTDLVIRLWEKHPRFSAMATCAMRRVLAEAEALLLLSREVRATAKSRLSNGVLLVPSELSFGPVDPTRDLGDGNRSDPFDADLNEAMITPIQEEGSASSVVPLIIRGPAEFLRDVRHLTLDRALDPILDARIESRIIRIARGLNMPVEVATGLMATTFANAVQVKKSEFEDHVEPRAVTMCDAITAGYFQWSLEQAGVTPEIARTIFVWFDPSDVIVEEDNSETSLAAHTALVISDKAYRERLGFTDEDAPDNAEVLLRLLLDSPRMDPFLASQILRKSGLMPDIIIPAPAAGVYGVEDPVSAMPAVVPPPGTEPALPTGATPDDATPPTPQTPPPKPGVSPSKTEKPPPQTAPGPDATKAEKAIAASAGPDAWARLGKALAGIDRDLRHHIVLAADTAMRAALERAGAKVRAKVQRGRVKDTLRAAADRCPENRRLAASLGREVLAAAGVTEGDLIDGAAFAPLKVDVATWLHTAYRRAIAAVAAVAGPLDEAALAQAEAEHVVSTATATNWLAANLTALAHTRLFAAGPTTKGETDDTVLVPASLVRVVVAIAGGARPTGGTILTGGAWAELAGGPVTASDGGPLSGIATGPGIMALVTGHGGRTEAYQWEYGPGVRAEFQPHLDLDTIIRPDPSGFEWPPSYDGWPENDIPFPGDHDGCTCDLTPILVSALGDIDTETPDDMGTGDLGDDTDDGLGDDDTDDMAAEPVEAPTPEVRAFDTDGGYLPSQASPAAYADYYDFSADPAEVPKLSGRQAKIQLNEVRAGIKDTAAQIGAEHTALIESWEGGRLDYEATTADWFQALSSNERERLAQFWMTKPGERGLSADEMEPHIARTFGLEASQGTNLMMKWVDETRIAQAASSLGRGALIGTRNADRYGGMSINTIIDSPYDLNELFGAQPDAIAYLAAQGDTASADEAAEILGHPAGTAPWEMTEADYVAECERLAAQVGEAEPTGVDGWGDEEFSPEDTAASDRLGELIPDGVEDANVPLTSVYYAIVRLARIAGML